METEIKRKENIPMSNKSGIWQNKYENISISVPLLFHRNSIPVGELFPGMFIENIEYLLTCSQGKIISMSSWERVKQTFDLVNFYILNAWYEVYIFQLSLRSFSCQNWEIGLEWIREMCNIVFSTYSIRRLGIGQIEIILGN